MLAKIGEILEFIWNLLSFIPTTFASIVQLIYNFFVAFQTVSRLTGASGFGGMSRLLSWYMPDEYQVLFASLVSTVLFLGMLKFTKRVFSL